MSVINEIVKLKNYRFFNYFILIAFLLFMCSSNDKKEIPKKEISHLINSDVNIELDIELSDARKPVIKGITNLPEGTKIIMSIKGESTKFIGQDKTTVTNGRFEGGPFGPIQGLPIGKYIANVIIPYSFVQPISVQNIIGKKGEKLKGPLVQLTKLGTFVEVNKEFEINTQNNKSYPGVFGKDGNFITNEILPFERDVYDGLNKEYEFNPIPKPNDFKSDKEWINATKKVESLCAKHVAAKFNIDEKTVNDIYFKIIYLKHKN